MVIYLIKIDQFFVMHRNRKIINTKYNGWMDDFYPFLIIFLTISTVLLSESNILI